MTLIILEVSDTVMEERGALIVLVRHLMSGVEEGFLLESVRYLRCPQEIGFHGPCENNPGSQHHRG